MNENNLGFLNPIGAGKTNRTECVFKVDSNTDISFRSAMLKNEKLIFSVFYETQIKKVLYSMSLLPISPNTISIR